MDSLSVAPTFADEDADRDLREAEDGGSSDTLGPASSASSATLKDLDVLDRGEGRVEGGSRRCREVHVSTCPQNTVAAGHGRHSRHASLGSADRRSGTSLRTKDIAALGPLQRTNLLLKAMNMDVEEAEAALSCSVPPSPHLSQESQGPPLRTKRASGQGDPSAPVG